MPSYPKVPVEYDLQHAQWRVDESSRDRRAKVAYRDEVIRHAYGSGMTYEAIGEAVGLTKERIRQICDLSKRKGEE